MGNERPKNEAREWRIRPFSSAPIPQVPAESEVDLFYEICSDSFPLVPGSYQNGGGEDGLARAGRVDIAGGGT